MSPEVKEIVFLASLFTGLGILLIEWLQRRKDKNGK